MTQDKIKAYYATEMAIKSSEFDVDEYPDICPICHKGIEPALRYAWHEDYTIAAIFRCPKRKCGNLFVSFFEKKRSISPTGPAYSTYEYKGSAPKIPQEYIFPDGIKSISEMFSTIYNESAEAEQRGLKNICGAGYRKALEFLIKDYLIKEKKLDAEKIQKTYLRPCIKQYVDEINIKECADRAALLGNDETHYYRIWEDKDLKDLKILIDLTINWIQREYLTKKYKSEMSEDKKRGG